ncbi:MAG: hypothetical protein ACKVQJ_10760 [Pyrinomonadaceae bacterium]
MNNKRITIILTLILGVSCIAGFSLQRRSAEASNEIDLSLGIPKKEVKLGEMLSIETKITNNSSLPVYLEGDSNYAVSIKIAFEEDKDYRLYVPEGPLISLDGVYIPTKIDPQETFRKQCAILWNRNFSTEVKNLSKEAAESYIGGKILTDYAFPGAGTYFIKAVTTVMKSNKPFLIESGPIQITVREPQGEDLEIWNKIKNNSEFAHFLQYGDMTRGYKKPEERTRFQQEVEQILADHPNSFYATNLRQSLDKFSANEAKRRESLEKLQKQKPQ